MTTSHTTSTLHPASGVEMDAMPSRDPKGFADCRAKGCAMNKARAQHRVLEVLDYLRRNTSSLTLSHR